MRKASLGFLFGACSIVSKTTWDASATVVTLGSQKYRTKMRYMNQKSILRTAPIAGTAIDSFVGHRNQAAYTHTQRQVLHQQGFFYTAKGNRQR